MEQILNCIADIAGIVVAIAFAYLAKVAAPYIKEWKLDRFITAMVKAAEQLYKEGDDDGNIRLSYVHTMLVDAGYELTDAVRALVESKVYDLNKNQELRG